MSIFQRLAREAPKWVVPIAAVVGIAVYTGNTASLGLGGTRKVTAEPIRSLGDTKPANNNK
jgi:hypothetical protein